MKTDINTIHLIIYSAVAVALLALGIGAVLCWHGDKDVALVILGAPTSVSGGLLALLAKTTTTDPNKPAPVEATNPSTDPVPVTTPDAIQDAIQ